MKQVPKRAVAKRGHASKARGPDAATDLLREGLKHSAVHFNLGQQAIVVTEDRMRLDLNELLHSATQRHAWQAPAGILVTEVAAFATSQFHDALGISGQGWDALFRVLLVFTFCWLIVALIRGRRRPSVDSVIESLKTRQQSSRTGGNQS